MHCKPSRPAAPATGAVDQRFSGSLSAPLYPVPTATYHAPQRGRGGALRGGFGRVGRPPAHHRPRFEPRARWLRTARCARPQAPVRERPGVRLALEVRYLERRAHLPVVSPTRAVAQRVLRSVPTRSPACPCVLSVGRSSLNSSSSTLRFAGPHVPRARSWRSGHGETRRWTVPISMSYVTAPPAHALYGQSTRGIRSLPDELLP